MSKFFEALERAERERAGRNHDRDGGASPTEEAVREDVAARPSAKDLREDVAAGRRKASARMARRAGGPRTP